LRAVRISRADTFLVCARARRLALAARILILVLILGAYPDRGDHAHSGHRTNKQHHQHQVSLPGHSSPPIVVNESTTAQICLSGNEGCGYLIRQSGWQMYDRLQKKLLMEN
jgi:hypothetical protein